MMKPGRPSIENRVNRPIRALPWLATQTATNWPDLSHRTTQSNTAPGVAATGRSRGRLDNAMLGAADSDMTTAGAAVVAAGSTAAEGTAEADSPAEVDATGDVVGSTAGVGVGVGAIVGTAVGEAPGPGTGSRVRSDHVSKYKSPLPGCHNPDDWSN